VSFHLNKSRPPPGLGWSLALAALTAFLAASCEKDHGQVARSGPSSANPIEDQLRPPPSVEFQEGTAAIVILDTSGSMKDKVKDADGEKKPKLQIARRAVLELVRQFERFAIEHKDRRVSLGIYEFSSRDKGPHCRKSLPLGPPDLRAAETALKAIKAEGGTPIGDAMIVAKRDLDQTRLARRHILVVTDGQNTRGYQPGDVAQAIARQREKDRASIYFVAFDIKADRFNPVRDAGGLVLAASDERDLNQALDYLLTGKILVEAPNTPANR
jgi:Mg-chelatase subunit ChlD